MKPSIRVCIAYIAGTLIHRKSFSSVQEQGAEGNYRMSGSFVSGNIDVQDHEGAKIVGMTSGKDVSFFHAGENVSVSFELNGPQFKGFDGGSGRSFNGAVADGSVKVYDYCEGKYFIYSLA